MKTTIKNWLKSRIHRITTALAVSLAAVLLWSPAGFSARLTATDGQPGTALTGTENTKSEEKTVPFIAWWGTLYPKFCLVDTEDTSDGEAKEVKIKPAFWIVENFARLLQQ